jgi:histidinol-phosphate aminotransferase
MNLKISLQMVQTDMMEYVKPWVHKLKPYSPGKTVEGMVKLASNENNYGPSPKVVEGLRGRVGRVYMYPYRDLDVREALAGYVGVGVEGIVLGNGSDELIDLVVRAFKPPVAGHYPTFLEYPAYTRIYGEEYVSVPLNDDFSFNAEVFIREAGRANLLFLCTPNNPTGTIIEREDIIKVVETGRIVVVDEAYYEFCGSTVVDLIPEYGNLIVLRTLAKAFGLAGLRVGYAVCNPDVAGVLGKVKPPFNVNCLAHEAVLLALGDLEYMHDTVERLKADRGMLVRELSKRFRVVPSHTNFVLVDVSPFTAQEFFERMLEQGIVVRPFGSFDGFGGEFVRITVGTGVENGGLVSALEKLG